MSEDNEPIFVIHRSMIDRFLSSKLRTGGSAEELNKLTVKDLLDDPEYKRIVSNTFATVSADVTLGEAKAAMESQSGAQDVMVTSTGKKGGKLVGWITNVLILENSSVRSGPTGARR